MAYQDYGEARTHSSRSQGFHLRSDFGPDLGPDLIAVQNDGRHLASFLSDDRSGNLIVNHPRKCTYHPRITKFILRVACQELT